MKLKEIFGIEDGAVVVEATLALPLFMFAIMIIYSMFNISLAQARISSALSETAKEISQYAYLYDLTGLNKKQANLAEKGGTAGNIIDENLSGVKNFYDAFNGLSKGASTMLESPENTESFLYYLLNQGIEAAKGGITGELSKQMMKKYFGKEPEKTLKRWGVSDLSLSDSRIFEDGKSSCVCLNAKYKVTVIKLLDIDIDFDFELCSKTRAWVGS